jgi:hypothetical protein
MKISIWVHACVHKIPVAYILNIGMEFDRGVYGGFKSILAENVGKYIFYQTSFLQVWFTSCGVVSPLLILLVSGSNVLGCYVRFPD